VAERPSQPPSPGGSELAGLAVLLAAVVVVPLLVGLWADASLGTAPLGVVLGILLGIVAALAVVYVRFKRYL